ncbi:hypothetical protein [Flavobacterium hibernum]|uniref:Uncharacterized protein n=1 Tax=Flavobacterium hibernum TaxID=37752 RepID=A0A0D0F989_9FLAO|nr:hypothetical protein [Flavobacterium hibernum]KIO54547.1 hypothetical protein IW18_00580 [Flavobacterium hibernum]OXA84610.1 hypothetical protein B0A73_18480 [Flavobacterium hibernum]STO10299.1 Uncharacterised protein [Flavobacterium hibernum]
MSKSFKIIFDSLIYEPFNYRLEIKNRLYNLSYSLQKSFTNNQENYELNIDDLDYKGIYSLGGGLCFSAFHWNEDIEKRINERSSINNFTGIPFFLGTDNEKIELNKDDKKKLINFPKDYFDNFIRKIKNLNVSSESNKIIDNQKQFTIDIDDPTSIETSVAEYNFNYKTNFFVSEIQLIDQLYFATIEVTKASLVDIFCLGYKIYLDDERRN